VCLICVIKKPQYRGGQGSYMDCSAIGGGGVLFIIVEVYLMTLCQQLRLYSV
jgi:hypothetical protein